jgi:hypothetical protein
MNVAVADVFYKRRLIDQIVNKFGITFNDLAQD